LEEISRLQVTSIDLDHKLVRLHGKGDRERATPLTTLAFKLWFIILFSS